MKKLLSWFNENRYNIVTLGLGGSYFWFLTFVHNVAEGDWKFFASEDVSPLYGIERWFNWSSRLLIEDACNFFAHHIVFWALITVITGAILFWSVGRILNHKRIYQSLMLFSIFLTINLYILSTAGVFATTINYSWPLACFAFVIAGVLRPFKNKKLAQIFNVIMIPMFIFAVCSEQIAMLGVFLFTGYIIYCKIEKKKVPRKVLVLLALSVLGIINTLVSPGNTRRTKLESDSGWKNFSTLSLKSKIVIGTTATMSRLFFAPQLPVILLVVLIGAVAFNNKNIQALVSILPSLVLVYLFNFSETFSSHIVNENYFKSLRTLALGFDQFNFPDSHQIKIYFIIFTVLIVSILSSILFLYGKTKKTAIIMASLLGGGAVSLAISLSPTIFASNTRTLYPLLIILVGVSAMMLDEILIDKFAMGGNNKKLRRKNG